MKITIEELRALLAEACGTAEAGKPGTDLLDTGLLDSLGLITLLEGLEDRGVPLQPTQVPRETFHTAESILTAIEKENTFNKSGPLPPRRGEVSAKLTEGFAASLHRS